MKQRPEPTNSAIVQDFILAWELPALLVCDWWSTALQSFCYDCRPAHKAGSDEDEGQLVVPEPIEEEGEHVFA